MIPPMIQPSIDHLKEVRLLESFSDQELQKLLNMGNELKFEVYSNIVIEGEMSWGLYLILEGIVGVYKTNKLTGQSYDVRQLRSGNSFGELSLVDENPRAATVKALTSVTLLYISKENFLGLLSSSSDLKARFQESCLKVLIQMLRELDENYVISQFQLWQIALKKEEEKK